MTPLTKHVDTTHKRSVETTQRPTDFEALRISIASPQQILDWSYGEVVKPETINYRTQKPERDGLFDERIFGPTKDWECYCGKYKKIRYKGVICDRCGVEVTRSSVRRERMGHIDLSVPVSHIWYVRGVPSILGLILDMSVNDLEKVIYFASFIILNVNEDVKKEGLERLEKEYKHLKARLLKTLESPQAPEVLQLDGQYKAAKNEIEGLVAKKVISETKNYELSFKYGNIISVGIGAEAIAELLNQFNIGEEITKLSSMAINTQGAAQRRTLKRLTLLKSLKAAGIDPAWLILTRVPVIAPDLRPMVQLDGGRFATSDLNDLYRRVLNRNNRLRRLLLQGAPNVIIRNEKRMLQEAVDSLIDNSARRSRSSASAAQRKLKSLSDMLRGKQGRFRQNLLGKRVDYSGRSVIVAGPSLKLHQCGLPKAMALELFKPFVVSKLINEGFVHNVRNASRLIERGTEEVWDILERITAEKLVLLNRAPTLHRLGIQAFQPVLIEGKAIQVHPLVCQAFNADFDGDQMAVHIPLSEEACEEARTIMLSSVNLLKPSSGEPIVAPRLDMVLGCYYLTGIEKNRAGENKIFSNEDEAMLAWQNQYVFLRSPIIVRINGNRVDTTVGRVIFNRSLPANIDFINDQMDSKKLRELVGHVYREFGNQTTAELVDSLKDLGFKYAEKSGITMSMSDVFVPANKAELIGKAEKEQEEITGRYNAGLISAQERSLATTGLWGNVRDELSAEMKAGMSPDSPLTTMVTSGARGSMAQVTQLGAIKGLVVNSTGQVIEIPIKHNYCEGLNAFEYFISTHAARKGRADTSLRTADAGYLTRRLVDVAQDVIVNAEDCGTEKGLTIKLEGTDPTAIERFESQILGRISSQTVKANGKTLVTKSEMITQSIVNKITEAKITEVIVRSPLYCQEQFGLCQYCYGIDLATGKIVKLGEAVGIMAAQAIGEPGTQLTMRTFHTGGVMSSLDITQGLPRVEELFESRSPHAPAVISEISGKVKIKETQDKTTLYVQSDEIVKETIELSETYEASVKSGDIVKAKQAIATSPNLKALRTPIGGKVEIKGSRVIITALESVTKEYEVPAYAGVKVKNNEVITKGTILTEGHLNLAQNLELNGELATQRYIIDGVQEVYSAQGQAINDKHIEIIVRRMFSKVRILDPLDSGHLEGEIVDRLTIDEQAAERTKNKQEQITHEPAVLGITRIALKTDSFLAAASFMETTSVLIEAATRGAVDNLRGLKENVIIGKLIHAGTGHKSRIKAEPATEAEPVE